jgi:hypothetical protein
LQAVLVRWLQSLLSKSVGLWPVRLCGLGLIFLGLWHLSQAVTSNSESTAITAMGEMLLGLFVLLVSSREKLLEPFDRAVKYAQGVEGAHRHQWYGFKGQRVRIELDAKRQIWFSSLDIAAILDLDLATKPFELFGTSQYRKFPKKTDAYLFESGLMHLLKVSQHSDAKALRLWIEREVRLDIARQRIQGRL